jgi:molybdate transport system substrate-binding protein
MAFTQRIGAALLIALAFAGPARAGEGVLVFAAASLTNALQDIGKAYKAKTGKILRLSFASSSILAKQIEAGAPAQIFASADEKWMDYLAKRNLVVKGSRVSPIGNRLVLIAPAASSIAPLDIKPGLKLADLLGADGRLAVGDPAHVPAGIYAKQALSRLGLWDAIEPRLARADNVRGALSLVEAGEAPLGIVYATDAANAKKVRVVGEFPADSHAPITYPFAIVAGQDSAEAKQVFAFLTGAEAAAIYAKYGFTRNEGS